MAVVLDANRIGRTLTRIAHEIVERSRGVEELAFVGIQRRGVPLARRLAALVVRSRAPRCPWARSTSPSIAMTSCVTRSAGSRSSDRRTSSSPSTTSGSLLVDDVLYTGRTIRAALDALLEFGRPRSIQLVVLVDRGHRELPIKADYVGKNLPTALSQSVQVRLTEVDGTDEVEIQE